MLKFFKGHSLEAVAFVISSFVFGVLLRFYDLSAQSPWTDELASWWYLRNLQQVWAMDVHNPFYYGVLRAILGSDATITGIRLVSAFISVLHLVFFFFLGQNALEKKSFIIFWILICLFPLDIIFARMARPYSWYLESFILFTFLLRINAAIGWKALSAFILGSLHVFGLIPVFVLAGVDFFKRRNKRDFLIVASTGIPTILFYLLRKSGENNLAWNTAGTFDLWRGLLVQFLGDVYPRSWHFPVSFYLAVSIFLLSAALFLYRRKKTFFLLLVISLIAVEILSYRVNVRVNRYLIYLAGMWVISLAESVKNIRPAFIYLLMMAGLYFQNPLLTYTWEAERVSIWKDLRAQEPDVAEFICVNRYQRDYYQLQAPDHCLSAVNTIDLKKPLHFLDINGNDRLLMLYLINHMHITQSIQEARPGFILLLKPRDETK